MPAAGGSARLEISGALAPPDYVLGRLVRTAFAMVGEDRPDVEIHLKGRSGTIDRWISVCRAAGGCGRSTNTALPGGQVGHLATSRDRAVAAAGSRVAHHRPARARVQRIGFAGTTYGGVPHLASVGAGVLWLVTIRMDRAPRDRDYPRLTRYPRLKTAPSVTLNGWREELVAVAAHEAQHVHQFRNGRRRSEIEAERVAHRVLDDVRRAAPALLQP